MSRPSITAATATPDGARLELDTGEVLQVPHEENAGLVTSAQPYTLRLEGQDRALTVPPELVAQVAQALGIDCRPPALPS